MVRPIECIIGEGVEELPGGVIVHGIGHARVEWTDRCEVIGHERGGAIVIGPLDDVVFVLERDLGRGHEDFFTKEGSGDGVVLADDDKKERGRGDVVIISEHCVVADVRLNSHDSSRNREPGCNGFGCHLCSDSATEGMTDDCEMLGLRVNMVRGLEDNKRLFDCPDSMEGGKADADNPTELVTGVNDDVAMANKMCDPGLVVGWSLSGVTVNKDDDGGGDGCRVCGLKNPKGPGAKAIFVLGDVSICVVRASRTISRL